MTNYSDEHSIKNKNAEEQIIENLLSYSEPRPSIDPVRKERVRQTLEQQWKKEYILPRPSGRSRLIALASCAAMIFICVGYLGLKPTPATLNMSVSSIHGIIQTKEGYQLKLGDLLLNETQIITSKNSGIALNLSGSASVRIDANSIVKLHADDTFGLVRGAIYYDSGSASKSEEKITLYTPVGIARNMGTQFEARLSGSDVRLRVREGEVYLQAGENMNREGLRLTEGNDVLLSQHVVKEKNTVSKNDKSWDWATQLAPQFELEGSTAHEFLEWACREKGLTLAYTNANIEAQLKAQKLHGSIDNISIDEAIENIASVTGFKYSIIDTTLRIE